jgi:hypothetical protein
MRRSEVGGYRLTGTCPVGHLGDLVVTLPDYGDAPDLYQCAGCGQLIGVSRDAQSYVGPAWDQKRISESCPNCETSLADAWLYPDHFRCSICAEIGTQLMRPATYPPDDQRVTIEVWDPYQ